MTQDKVTKARSSRRGNAPEAAAPPHDEMQPTTAEQPKDPKGKLGEVVALLRRPEGATLEALMGATGWQAHSVRGVLSGALKKKLGLTITSEKTDGERTYRLVQVAK